MSNFAHVWPLLMEGTRDTLYMVFLSGLFGYLLGLPLGVLLIATDKGGLWPCRWFNAALGWVVNIGRSIPFIILIIALMPFTKVVVGKMTGNNAAIVALVIAAAPFIARLVESSLAEIDRGVIEAARTMGATNWEIILKVLLPESVPSLVRGMSIAVITLIGYSAMAGAVGAGGLGMIAITYGYHRYQYDVMGYTIILLVILVQIIQVVFDLLAKVIDRRNK